MIPELSVSHMEDAGVTTATAALDQILPCKHLLSTCRGNADITLTKVRHWETLNSTAKQNEPKWDEMK